MTSGVLLKTLSNTLNRRRSTGGFLTPPDPKEQASAIDFGSNDVLSISSGVLREEFLRELQAYPEFTVGSRGSRVVDSPSPYLGELESYLAKYHNAKDAFFFNSGFEANVAIWSTIPQPGDVVIYDELIHASTHEGLKRSRSQEQHVFVHNDTESFRKVLHSIKPRYPEVTNGSRSLFVALESVYSMDGDICWVNNFLAIAREALPEADLVFAVDEAHSNGIIGPKGSGLVCHLNLENDIAIRLHTFGKAIGCTGAVILCDPIIKQTLFNYARNFMYTTGPTFPALAAVRASYRLLENAESEMQRRKRLQDNVLAFCATLRQSPSWQAVEQTGKLSMPNQGTEATGLRIPIVPIITPPGESRKLEERLLREGFLAHAVQFPIVPRNSERVRIMIHADNTLEDIKNLVKTILEWSEGRILQPREKI